MQLKYLSRISSPADIKTYSLAELRELCQEIRRYTIEIVSNVGGHLASTLGAVELTVALHKVFNAPVDKIIWDVGHQAYAHKLLTGRFDRFPTIRQLCGLSGFLKRSESEYDVFGAGHASTSISAATGVAVARDQMGENYHVVAVIGDGAMTGGLAFEGLNNAGNLKRPMLVILNDNEMSISPNVGAINTYLTKLVSNPLYNRIRDEVWHLTGKLPLGKQKTRSLLHRVEESLKSFLVPGMLFEELGFRYFGPIDGHNLEELIKTLENLKNLKLPVLLHIITKKGKGMRLAENDPVRYHGVSPNPANGKAGDKIGIPSFQAVFGTLAGEIGRNRRDTVCITAAMKEGTGLVQFANEFPERFFDVGIAEGHAVTFSAGLASQGIRPIMAIYSTFLQRAYDHLIHDVAIQHLPVVFCLDRAGIAGEDGPTHHGALDIAYLRCVQDMIVTAPKNGNELRHLMYTALNQQEYPFSIRYPKGDAVEFDRDEQNVLLPIGSWAVEQSGSDVAILAVGPLVYEAVKAAEVLAGEGVSCEVVNCRFIKPMDKPYLEYLVSRFDRVITIEEGVTSGGFGEGVVSWLGTHGFKGKTKILALPDRFIEQGPRLVLLQQLGLSSEGLVHAVQTLTQEIQQTV
ncbi:MAG: 1-deoxy-D-xylulose-5-phosphate synthase [Fidelibacterota bacterium]